MLNVLIDARPLRNPLSGVGQYVLHLGLALQQAPDVRTRLMAFDFLAHSNELVRSPVMEQFNRTLWTRTALHRKLFNGLAAYAPTAISSLAMPRFQGVVHGTYFEQLPLVPRTARVSTVHDVAFLRHPEYFSKQNRNASRRALEQQIRQSDLLIAVSNFTRQELISLCGVEPDRVAVTPLAPTETAPRLLDASKRPKPYFLFIGNLEPRKNLPRALQAWTVSGLQRDFDLVVVGGRLRSQVAQDLRLADVPGVVPMGYVDASVKWHLLQNATGFLWPSLYEGFGIPVLEAMAASVPVITSRGSAMEELTGTAAWLVDPEDVDEIASALQDVARNTEQAQAWGRLGAVRAAKFTWTATAERTAAAYHTAVALSSERLNRRSGT